MRNKTFNYTVHRLACWYQHHHFAWLFKTVYHFFKGSYAFYYFLCIRGTSFQGLTLLNVFIKTNNSKLMSCHIQEQVTTHDSETNHSEIVLDVLFHSWLRF